MENREAIASLKTLCNTCTMYPKCVNDKPECFQAIEMAISALEKQERDKWVPCSERKPDIDSEVFITDSFGEIGHAYYVNLGDRICFVTAEECTILEDVKAWKLVPEAYKGED